MIPLHWPEPLDPAICWRGGSENQYQKHKRRGEEPCRNCVAAATRAKEDRDRKAGKIP